MKPKTTTHELKACFLLNIIGLALFHRFLYCFQKENPVGIIIGLNHHSSCVCSIHNHIPCGHNHIFKLDQGLQAHISTCWTKSNLHANLLLIKQDISNVF